MLNSFHKYGMLNLHSRPASAGRKGGRAGCVSGGTNAGPSVHWLAENSSYSCRGQGKLSVGPMAWATPHVQEAAPRAHGVEGMWWTAASQSARGGWLLQGFRCVVVMQV